MTRPRSMSCNSYKEITRETEITNCAPFLVIQLKHFAVVNGQLIKDEEQLSVFPFYKKSLECQSAQMMLSLHVISMILLLQTAILARWTRAIIRQLPKTKQKLVLLQ